MPHLKLWPHMQNMRKGFLHTHSSEGLETKPSSPPFIPVSASPTTPSHPLSSLPLPRSGESMGKGTLCAERLGGHPARNCSRAVCSALRLLVFRQRGGRFEHPVPLELMRQAANILISMSQLFKNNSWNFSKLQSVEMKAAKQWHNNQEYLLAKTRFATATISELFEDA